MVSIVIGNCKVELSAKVHYAQTAESIRVEVPDQGSIQISVDTTEMRNFPSVGAPKLILLNPKTLDNWGQLMLQEVVQLYSNELPAMSYAANTGKQSPFLERCVRNGKYCTLVLKQENKVLAAMTYQIIPSNVSYAEIPLAAVNKTEQHKGLGAYLYNELKRRLCDIGVSTIFCWSDQESEVFWSKQGFIKMADVDGRGRPQKLPLKAELRKAMSIPGSATLMVSHADVSTRAPPRLLTGELCGATNPAACQKPSPVLMIKTPNAADLKSNGDVISIQNVTPLVNREALVPFNMEHALSKVACSDSTAHPPCPGLPIATSFPEAHVEEDVEVPIAKETVKYGTENFDPAFIHTENGKIAKAKVGKRGRSKTPSNRQARRCLRSRGSCSTEENGPGHLHDLELVPDSQDLSANRMCANGTSGDPVALGENLERRNEALDSSDQAGHEILKIRNEALDNFNNCTRHDAAAPGEKLESRNEALDDFRTDHACREQAPVILFMNMANEQRRLQLTKFVEGLGGAVTNEGSKCTHVVTGQVRRTLNFCAAICAGAWVVSPDWLKASVQAENFVDPSSFIVKDADFQLKYKIDVGTVVSRAKRSSRSLFRGLSVYLSPHVEPRIDILSQLIELAGGKILSTLEEALIRRDTWNVLVVVCERDMLEALSAAKAGVRTFNTEWLLCSIMKQELDFTGPQFTESLEHVQWWRVSRTHSTLLTSDRDKRALEIIADAEGLLLDVANDRNWDRGWCKGKAESPRPIHWNQNVASR